MGKNRCNRRRTPASNSSAGGWQRSKVKGRNNRGSSAFAEEKDVTLDAFANNACSRALAGRASKAIAMSVSKEIKQVESASQILAKTEDEEILEDWYEGTFDDDTPLEGYSAQAEFEEGEGYLQISAEVPDVENDRVKQKKETSGSSETDAYCVYHSIIWYLVSAYICPEDVGRFACLCRETYAVTNTAGFWRRLYFRYYNTDSARYLPPDLHPTTIQRSFGLRSLVIRSLQYIYRPLASNISLRNSNIFSNGNESVERITGMRFMYHVGKQHVGSNYVYYLKFHRPEVEDQRAVEALAPDPDIHFNSHSGQCILMVICKFPHHFKLEGMMGMELVYVSMSVSAGMMYSKLKMEFQEPSALRQRRSQGHGQRGPSSRKCDRVTVILDPVVQTRVCPWWHPHFQEEKFQVGSVPMNDNLNMWNAT